MPKQYGAPTGPASPAAGAQRPKAGQASPQEIHQRLDAYEKHLNDEHMRIQAVRAKVPRGTSGGMPSGLRGRQIDREVDKQSK